MRSIDLNCDLGESFGRYTMGLDDQVIPLVSSVNVACGMHAGDPTVMRRTVRMAAQAGVAIGAHPGYPDLQGFGRRDMNLSPDEAYSFVLYQIGALAGFCAAEGTQLHHVKPHGQLYNRAAADRALADAIAAAVRDFDPQLVLVGLAGGQLVEAGESLGLRCASEFFADRNYTDEGELAPRSMPNATLTDEAFAVKRAVRAVREGTIESITGKTIRVSADTICTHGDNVRALEFVRELRRALEGANVEIKPV
ncbi:MAG: 5-oxoprolinase subunit PxpA [Berryella intestinalis]|uniref:LamB/YcsF family protein n=1 Tax=Berryella intestinalis TaxID=1531429 RepID=UPI002A595DCA|nr:5-oxoprolinase subunit PxpA [Berryella intestinalis]MDD7368414.1 5-oxoprolinase subunit PxpA [Berryella intestinalis]MDY3128544.1 5-oxoprolinase subunit PxpA [Berryella intestinalis]